MLPEASDVFSTRARVLDVFSARAPQVQTLVLDEVDQLLDQGFQQSVERIVAKLPRARQTLCFSATVHERRL